MLFFTKEEKCEIKTAVIKGDLTSLKKLNNSGVDVTGYFGVSACVHVFAV